MMITIIIAEPFFFCLRKQLQEALMMADTLLTMYDENGARKRRNLEECALIFKNITEGDLPKRLDVVAEV